MNITGSSATSAPDYYYFYYNIEIEVPCVGIITQSYDCDGQGNCFDPGNGNGLYSSLNDCQNNCHLTGINDLKNNKKVRFITDLLGQKTIYRSNNILIYQYEDGTVEKKVIIK